jgi:nucleoid DNA-binding protein
LSMAVRKKASRKKAAPRARAKSAARKPARATLGKKAPTKTEIFGIIADHTELSKRDVRNVFDTLSELAGRVLAKGAGQFTIPGLCKLVVKTTPARKARKGVNPFTGEEMMFKAKPKSKTVRARAVKALKDSVV